MRMGHLLLVVVTAGCQFSGNPRVDITSPDDNANIAGHGSSQITVEVWDMEATSFDILVDGERLTENLSVAPRPDGRDCAPCTFHITWPTASVGEGLHVVTAAVYDQTGDSYVDDVALTFDDIPEITGASPQDEDLRGVGMVDVQLELVERGTVTVELAIDGVSAGTRSNESCRAGCMLGWPWDTRDLPAGSHELAFTATDAHGNQAQAKHIVELDDIVRVTAIEVDNIVDDVDPLEIEVYLYDDVTNTLIGCAGSAHGLGGVDVSGVRYVVDATLVNLQNTDLALHELGTHPVRFEVWEDDDAPVCPAILNPQGNDLVGNGPAKTADEWKANAEPLVFGNVGELSLAFDRPLTR
jgi:hypothetical protein